MKLKCAKTTFLKLFRRPLLASFLGTFTGELTAKGLTLPGGDLEDEDYYDGVAALMREPEGLPSNLFEALHSIQGMATPEGQARLEGAFAPLPLAANFFCDSTEAEYALQAFLAEPLLYARKFNEANLTRVGKFEFFRSKVPVDRSQTFAPPDADTIARMVNDLDEWFLKHGRGAQITVIEVVEINGEFWFVIRHGNTYARVPTAGENRNVAVMHFRPTTDDIVVFSPQFDELRTHAGTKGEGDLYREVFGTRLFGDALYFSERQTYSLDPLRLDGAESLEPIPGISKVVLRQVKWTWNNGHNEVFTHEADDVFAAVKDFDPGRLVIPATAKPVEAVFDFYFTGTTKARRVVVRPPNILKLARHCDAALVHAFLRARDFKTSVNGASDAAA